VPEIMPGVVALMAFARERWRWYGRMVVIR
jgi:hypothetical protein